MRFSAYTSQCILMIRWFIGRRGWLSEDFRVRPETLNGALFTRIQFFGVKISNGKAETELKLTLQLVLDFVRYGHQLLS